MKAVLISIQPQWCELIASGKKTVEIRKTVPKLEPPFKCYIYCTKDEKYCLDDGKRRLNGKVIGEFVCDGIYKALEHPSVFAGHPLFYTKTLKDSCLTPEEVEQYSGGKDLYGWHISNLAIYDEPKPLSRFMKPYGTIVRAFDSPYIQRPPQSWCYVGEMLEDG